MSQEQTQTSILDFPPINRSYGRTRFSFGPKGTHLIIQTTSSSLKKNSTSFKDNNNNIKNFTYKVLIGVLSFLFCP